MDEDYIDESQKKESKRVYIDDNGDFVIINHNTASLNWPMKTQALFQMSQIY